MAGRCNTAAENGRKKSCRAAITQTTGQPSGRAPINLTASFIYSSCTLMCNARSCWEVPSGSIPRPAIRSRTAEVFTALTTSALSFERIADGVFAGATSDHQFVNSKPGTVSEIDGRSGTSGVRFRLVTPRALSSPLLISGRDEGMFWNDMSTSPVSV